MISIIVAMSANHAIGYKGLLPWHLPEDLAHFKQITMGHTIIMGRHTFESLPHGALPGRRNIVLSRNVREKPHDYDICQSLEEALEKCDCNNEEVFIIGGAEVYRQSLHLVRKLYITLVDTDPVEADTFFPSIDMEAWTETKKEKHDGFSFIELSRRMN